MSASAVSSLREMLRKNKVLYASWHGLGVPLSIEMAAKAGWNIALIDQQHGFGGQSELMCGLLAGLAAGMPTCVRVAWNDPALIGRALDAGAAGVVCPMINSGEDARALVRAAKYPPIGARSFGPYRAAITGEGDYFSRANISTLTFAQIETKEAIDNIEVILATKGLDGIVVGPNDLAISLTGARTIDARPVLEAIETIRKMCTKADAVTWVFANTPEYAKPLMSVGWQIISIGSDTGWLASSAAGHLPSK